MGTHALIEPDVRFGSLAVAVIDEQHRFGVRQRAALGGGDGEHPPHTLHMTATPIPRTLALARYGDLDTSTLRELPRGRMPIETRLVAGETARSAAYEELRAELDAGRQAYVVCPLIEEAEDAPGPAAPHLRTRRGRRSGGARGDGGARAAARGRARGIRARPAARRDGAAREAAGDGCLRGGAGTGARGDDGHRGGHRRAQRHRDARRERRALRHLPAAPAARARGRGRHRSRCYLAGPSAVAGSPRLRALVAHADGFRLAEIDLELRKEGELIGTRQSGLETFRIARLPQDTGLLEIARARAEAIAAADPELRAPEHALLADALAGALDGRVLERSGD